MNRRAHAGTATTSRAKTRSRYSGASSPPRERPEQWRAKEYQRHGLPPNERAPEFSADKAKTVPDYRDGERTRARLDIHGGPDVHLGSGHGGGEIMRRFKELHDGRLPREQGFVPFNYHHVEAQAAAYMRMTDRRDGSLYVNQKPCTRRPHGCDRMLPHMLPTGARLTVFGPDGYMKVYRGNGDERPGG